MKFNSFPCAVAVAAATLVSASNTAVAFTSSCVGSGKIVGSSSSTTSPYLHVARFLGFGGTGASPHPAAFAPPAEIRTTTTTSSTTANRRPQQTSIIRKSKDTRLYISSWGARGPPSRWRNKAKEPEDPEKKIQSYLKSPEPVEARPNLDGTVLVSGWVHSKERTDQFVFDLLNHQDSAFTFTKIIAFVNDIKFAKKRLLSRSARYTGLLDKLDFLESTSEGALPTLEQLDGVKSWVANVEGGNIEMVKKIAELAKLAPFVENVSVLITDASSITADAALDAVKAFDSPDLAFSVVAVGSLNEKAEGAVPYQLRDFGTEDGLIPSNATFSRDESVRMVTECLGLKCATNKALSFQEVTNVNQTESKLIRGLREAGYTRPQEIDHMISKGVAAYKQAIEDYKKLKPEDVEDDEMKWFRMQEAELEKKQKEDEERKRKERETQKQREIEEIAREWAKREYFRQSMAGDMPYTEEEYIESVWDRALFEGDLKYRMMHGQKTDERKELAEFKEKQEKKKEAMLERAKAQMKEILSEEEDVKSSPVAAADDDDDDDEDDDE